MPELTSWDSFYVIVGSAAGALIGLQFVVLTLFAQRPHPRAAEANGAFATPTIIHFSAALFLSAAMRAPWPSIGAAAAAWGTLGLCGTVYGFIVTRRMRSQSAYRPELEDWLFHALFPLAAYAALVLAAVAAPRTAGTALFAVGGAALVLLFCGVHNAWDGVVYHVFVSRPRQERGDVGVEAGSEEDRSGRE